VRWADEPFAQLVHKAVADHGTLRPLQRRLADLGWPVSHATISNWQTGRTLPTDSPDGRARVMALESVLDLPSGNLMRVWQETRLRGTPTEKATEPSPAAARQRPATGELYNKETRKNEMIGRVEATGGWLSRNYLVATAVENDYLLGPDGLPLRSTIALSVYALRPGIDRYWYIYAFRGTDPNVDVRITPQTGCRLGNNDLQLTEQVPRSLTLDELVMATELRFGKALEPFTPHRFTYTVDYLYQNNPTGYLRPEFICVVTTPGIRYLRLSITFDSRARPRQLTRCTWKPDPRKPDGGLDTPLTQADAPSAQLDRLTQINPQTPRGYGWIWNGLADRAPASYKRTATRITT